METIVQLADRWCVRFHGNQNNTCTSCLYQLETNPFPNPPHKMGHITDSQRSSLPKIRKYIRDIFSICYLFSIWDHTFFSCMNSMRHGFQGQFWAMYCWNKFPFSNSALGYCEKPYDYSHAVTVITKQHRISNWNHTNKCEHTFIQNIRETKCKVRKTKMCTSELHYKFKNYA